MHQKAWPGLEPPARLLLTALGALALCVPGYVLLPLPYDLRQAWYMGIAMSAVGVAWLGLRHNHPQRQRDWVLVLAGCTGWMVGDLTWTVEQYVWPNHYPAPSDVVYLFSYLAFGAGALAFVRTRRGGRDAAALLDAAIVTTGAGILVGVFMVAPLAHDSTLSLAAKAASAAYPLADLFLLGVIVRMYAEAGAQTLSYRLLTLSMTLTLIADVGYEVEVLVSGRSASTRWTDGAWLLAYLLIATAACIPSMKMLVEPPGDRAETAPSRRRPAALAGGLMLPGVVLLLDGLIGGAVHWPVIGVGSLLLSGLVLYRMTGLLNIVQIQTQRLSELARSDSLTGAPNRRSWDHELPRACAISRQSGTPLCVAMLDMDRFKAYNDTHGHQAGDRLLREAVAAWSQALPENALLARYGGEEFAVLIARVTTQDATRILHRLRTVTPGGQTFSAGIALWDPQTEPGSAIAQADQALYTAKRAGRDRVIVYSGSRPDRTLPTFTTVTQPIVDITTSTIASYEALTRFTGPENDGGVEEVFRRAHTAGDGDLLELAAIRAALELDGRPEGHDLYVNVSARAVTSERFLAGLPEHLPGVVIEISEDPDDVALASVAQAVAILRARGARIALDDVGAGAQEFARLATLRPDIIKVDRSLVAGCADDAGCSAVLSALVTYANELGLTVCAEGVEDNADLVHLLTLGITHAQGYLLARPGQSWQQQITVPIPI